MVSTFPSSKPRGARVVMCGRTAVGCTLPGPPCIQHFALMWGEVVSASTFLGPPTRSGLVPCHAGAFCSPSSRPPQTGPNTLALIMLSTTLQAPAVDASPTTTEGKGDVRKAFEVRVGDRGDTPPLFLVASVKWFVKSVRNKHRVRAVW